MDTTTPYEIGTAVACDDGVCGTLDRVVIDPVAVAVTHLVVEPKTRRGLPRLVPVGLVDPGAPGIRLRCGADGFEALERADDERFLPASRDHLGYPAERTLWLPYFRLGPEILGDDDVTVRGLGTLGVLKSEPIAADPTTTIDVLVRRGERVHAVDGAIGRVHGLVVDQRDHQVRYLLLALGHLWGTKEVAIPLSAVTDVADGIRLNLTKDEIRELPPVAVGQHN